jgi:hypothetical protein
MGLLKQQRVRNSLLVVGRSYFVFDLPWIQQQRMGFWYSILIGSRCGFF